MSVVVAIGAAAAGPVWLAVGADMATYQTV